MTPLRGRLSWVVSAQAHYAAFERMLDELSERFQPGCLLAGKRTGRRNRSLKVIYGPRYVRSSLRQRAASWLQFTGFSVVWLTRLTPRFVLVVTNPPIMPHVVWALSRARPFRFALLVWDIYPKALVDVGLLSDRHPLVALWHWANRWAYRSAVFVATLSAEMAEALVEDGCPREKIVVTPNWTDVEAIRPIPGERNKFRKEHGLVGKFVVMYSGNVGAGHALDGLVEAADLLRDDGRFAFVIIGRGLGLASLRQEVERRSLSSFLFLDPLPEEEFADAIAAADLAVVSQRPGAEAMSMPSKTYTAMAAGDAILALTKKTSSLGRLVSSEGIGVVCNPTDGEEIAETLLRLADNPEIVAEMGARARRLAEERYSVDAAVRKFEELFRKALETDQ